MASWIITGASGSLASACIEVLLAKGKVVYGFSRKMVEDDRILFKQVPNYHGIKFDTENCEGLLVAQGHFLYEHLDHPLGHMADKENLYYLIRCGEYQLCVHIRVPSMTSRVFTYPCQR